MNSAEEPESTDETATEERTRFQLSRMLDGDLTAEESVELAASHQNESDRAFQAAIINLRNQVRSLPVKPVSEAFATSVREAIYRELPVAASSAATRRDWTVRGTVAVSVIACAASLMFLLRPHDSNRDTTIAQSSGSSPSDDGVALLADDTGVSADSEMAASRQEAAKYEESADPQEDLRPFLENDDWRIVVVKVNSKDRESVMRDIEARIAMDGMSIRSINGDDHDSRFGVLLTSAGIDDKAFIESVVSVSDAQAADWDAQSVAESTRESLIHRLQESMRIPTHSELHFGQVYVALPNTSEIDGNADEVQLAKTIAVDDEVRIRPETAGKATERRSRIVAAPSSSKVPVLVVFEFTTASNDHI